MMPVNRREFLDTSLAAAGALFGVSGSASLQAERSRARRASPNETIQCALIGTGGRGQLLGRLAAEHQAADVVALCDVDQRNLQQAAEALEEQQGHRPRVKDDFRRILDDDSVDAVFIATPHHWHAPIALRALEDGKHVYVEKPASHVFGEGRLLVEAARKQQRVVQHGTQMRSSEVTRAAGEVLKSGLLGEIKMARAWSVEPRKHPQPVPDASPPDPLDWNFWLGPAPKRPFNRVRWQRWRWFRDYGNGEIGDDGVHDLDMACWGLGVETHPTRISATGGRIELDGATEFPNHLTVSYQYTDGRELLYETRNWAPYKMAGFDSGNAFYGTEGYMIFSRRGHFQTYLGSKEEEGPGMSGGGGTEPHVDDFLQAVRTGAGTNADAEIAHRSAALVHLGEIAYRTGRALEFDPEAETFPDDEEAATLLQKDYRSPWSL